MDILLANPELEAVCADWKMCATYEQAWNVFIQTFWNEKEQLKVVDEFERSIYNPDDKMYSTYSAFYSYWSGCLCYLYISDWSYRYRERKIRKLPPRLARAIDKAYANSDFEIYSVIREEEEVMEKERLTRNAVRPLSRSGMSGRPNSLANDAMREGERNAPSTKKINLTEISEESTFAPQAEETLGEEWEQEYEDEGWPCNSVTSQETNNADCASQGAIWDRELSLSDFVVTGDSAGVEFVDSMGPGTTKILSSLLESGLTPREYINRLKSCHNGSLSYVLVFLGRDFYSAQWEREPKAERETLVSQMREIIHILREKGNKGVLFVALNEFYKVTDERIFLKTKYFHQALIRAIKSSPQSIYLIPALGVFYRINCPPGGVLSMAKPSDLVFFDQFYARIDARGDVCVGYRLSKEGLNKLRDLIQRKVRTIDARLKFKDADEYLRRFREQVERDLGAAVRISIGEARFLACVDTGSPFNIITKNTWTKVIEKNKNLKPISFKERLDMKGVGGGLVLAEEIVYVDFTLNCYKSGITRNSTSSPGFLLAF